ncbi:MAG TPA: DNA ligase D [Thermoanaerobaculia bacterium]|nr:DNA ligase D [Thermoanaerobaculia bacterium]
MKPETCDQPFTRPGWLFELKYDGFRLLARRDAEGGARLLYRSGRDALRYFPEVGRDVAALPWEGVILDGEVVVLDERGRPSFQRLQRRGVHARPVESLLTADPAVYFVFDILALEGHDLRPLPLVTRKEVLRRVLPADGPLRYVEPVAERGEDFYEAVSRMGLEGIVAKKADSPYRAGYSADWQKIRVDQVADFAVVGFTPVPGTRTGFRRLHLAVHEGQGFRYAGRVGSGFSAAEYDEIRARLDTARRVRPRLTGPVPEGPGPVWVEPELVAEVRYKEWTEEGQLRQPIFLRLRDDKTVYECFRPGDEPEGDTAGGPGGPGGPGGDRPAQATGSVGDGEGGAHTKEPSRADPPQAPPPSPRFTNLTNLEKLFWPEEGYTKGDLIDYYRAVSPWMLPYLEDRPLVLDRYPDGIAGKSFFQKSAPEGARQLGDRLRTLPIRPEGSGRAIDYFLCDDEASLLFLVNLGAIPFHVWASRALSLDRPDWCILDLDPKGAPFANVVRIALAIRELCAAIELPSFIKTSGGSGLHVLLPMGRQLDHGQVRQLAELLAGVIAGRLPEIATTARAISKRRGRVYVDALQNGRGKLLVAPLSVRPLPGATVSTPLRWEEVGPDLDVRRFTIRSVPERLRGQEEDPLLPVLGQVPDLARSLELLSGLL